MLNAAQQEKLEALRRRFAERLPGLVAELEELARLPERREEATLRGHTLAGTAGTYGFAALGRAARALELLLRDGAPAEAVEGALRELRLNLP